MVEQSKFAGALGRLKQSPAKAAEKRPDNVSAVPLSESTAQGGRGGKRSDPDYSPTTFFVRKDTKRKAAQLLLNGAVPEKDLSDVVENLLAKWVDEHSHA